MTTYRRTDQSDGRVAFGFGPREGEEFRSVQIEIGNVVAEAGAGTEFANSGQLYMANFTRTDGTQDEGVAGFSVPAGIADEVAVVLASRGHTVL